MNLAQKRLYLDIGFNIKSKSTILGYPTINNKSYIFGISKHNFSFDRSFTAKKYMQLTQVWPLSYYTYIRILIDLNMKSLEKDWL